MHQIVFMNLQSRCPRELCQDCPLKRAMARNKTVGERKFDVQTVTLRKKIKELPLFFLTFCVLDGGALVDSFGELQPQKYLSARWW